MTLDHVTPRLGQSAYDRRDNLVLACKRCNTAKADKPFLAYVIGHRKRAENLLRYGQHLSEGILGILRPMVGDIMVAPPAPRPARKKQRFDAGHDGGESPYRDHESPYRKTA
jgi:hypothetical protein